MHKSAWLALAALFMAPVALAAQDGSQRPATAQIPQSPPASQTTAPASQQDPLAAAARKAREERKNASKPVKVFDNDNLPTEGGISTVGTATAPPKTETEQAAGAAAGGKKMSPAEWRAKFAALRKKLQQDQSELSVLQRETSQQMMQYYGGDPQKAAQDQASGHPLGEQYGKTKSAVADKQMQVQADQQAISDAQDALRQAGGDPGWSR
ncbi:MAG: hypothetical protein KGL02_00470 [Acidobacteriota bacterium]|nr:hypothetical protein [Acidobacteriota bacterium]